MKPRRQCKKCPWKVSTDPREINGYCEAKHAALVSTIAEPGALRASTDGMRWMACHETPVGKELPCVGWLVHQLGDGNNLALRMAVITGQVNADVETVGEQHTCLEDLYSSCSTPQEHADVLYRKLSELSQDRGPYIDRTDRDLELRSVLLGAFQRAENETVNALCFVIDGLASQLAKLQTTPELIGLLREMYDIAEALRTEELAPPAGLSDSLPDGVRRQLTDEFGKAWSEMATFKKTLDQITKRGFVVQETEHGPGMEVKGVNEVQAVAERDLGPTTRERLDALEGFAARVVRYVKADISTTKWRAARKSIADWEPKK